MDWWKAIATAALAALAAYFQVLLVPVFVLVGAMVLDYISGIASAWQRSELSSRVGIVGIVKKVLYLVIVAVGMIADYVIALTAEKLGANFEFNYIGLVVVIWLIINECISVLENVAEMGLPVPAVLDKLLKRLKERTEEEE